MRNDDVDASMIVFVAITGMEFTFIASSEEQAQRVYRKALAIMGRYDDEDFGPDPDDARDRAIDDLFLYETGHPDAPDEMRRDMRSIKDASRLEDLVRTNDRLIDEGLRGLGIPKSDLFGLNYGDPAAAQAEVRQAGENKVPWTLHRRFLSGMIAAEIALFAIGFAEHRGRVMACAIVAWVLTFCLVGVVMSNRQAKK